MTEQERLDKAINGLEQFIADFKPFCGNKADWQRVYDALDLLKAQEPADYIPIDWLMNYAQLPTEFAISAWRKPKKEAEIKQAKSLDKPMSLDDALELLKAQEPRVLTLRELAFYDAGIFVETRNGCPEGLTDELWPALGHLYCVSQNGEDGYVSFVNWNADTYDFEAKDYNVEFRCWTSRPTDAQREAIPWDG